MKRTLSNKWVLKGLVDGDHTLKPVNKAIDDVSLKIKKVMEIKNGF